MRREGALLHSGRDFRLTGLLQLSFHLAVADKGFYHFRQVLHLLMLLFLLAH